MQKAATVAAEKTTKRAEERHRMKTIKNLGRHLTRPWLIAAVAGLAQKGLTPLRIESNK